MSIKIQSSNIAKIMFGGTEISKAYVGTSLIYENIPTYTAIANGLWVQNASTVWDKATVPTDGATINIPAGKEVTLDGTTPGTYNPPVYSGLTMVGSTINVYGDLRLGTYNIDGAYIGYGSVSGATINLYTGSRFMWQYQGDNTYTTPDIQIRVDGNTKLGFLNDFQAFLATALEFTNSATIDTRKSYTNSSNKTISVRFKSLNISSGIIGTIANNNTDTKPPLLGSLGIGTLAYPMDYTVKGTDNGGSGLNIAAGGELIIDNTTTSNSSMGFILWGDHPNFHGTLEIRGGAGFPSNSNQATDPGTSVSVRNFQGGFPDMTGSTGTVKLRNGAGWQIGGPYSSISNCLGSGVTYDIDNACGMTFGYGGSGALNNLGGIIKLTGATATLRFAGFSNNQYRFTSIQPTVSNTLTIVRRDGSNNYYVETSSLDLQADLNVGVSTGCLAFRIRGITAGSSAYSLTSTGPIQFQATGSIKNFIRNSGTVTIDSTRTLTVEKCNNAGSWLSAGTYTMASLGWSGTGSLVVTIGGSI